MKSRINPKYIHLAPVLLANIKNFTITGKSIYDGKRNELKVFKEEELEYCIKSFKVPHIINRIIYKYFRKSKAERSFEYANLFIKKGIKTPIPIAFYEDLNFFGLLKSYYVCEYLNFDLRFKELLKLEDKTKKEIILRQFTQFTYQIQQENIEFIDHSPGNTLIFDKGNNVYEFYLVDLNRTNFDKKMLFDDRMKNFSKLTIDIDVIKIMSNEYAKIIGESETVVFDAMWSHTQKFQQKFQGKKRLKKKLKFWKK